VDVAGVAKVGARISALCPLRGADRGESCWRRSPTAARQPP
jgi:hypothetical protein